MNKINKHIILACTHKPFLIFKDDVIIPFHIGKKSSNLNLGYTGDDEGINISDKNPNYCELTAMYWAWKNALDFDIIGFCHYRRFFQFQNVCKDINDVYEDELITHKDNFIFRNMTLHNYDIILPEPIIFDKNLHLQYSEMHCEIDLIILRKIILDYSPEYIVSFDEVFNNNIFYPYNMFITHKNLFDNYCNWLFLILFELEKKIQIPNDFYQRRIFGFIGERLLNVWVLHNNLKVKNHKVLFIKQRSFFSKEDCIKYITSIENPFIYFKTKFILKMLIDKIRFLFS